MAGLNITPATQDQAQANTQNPQSVPSGTNVGGASTQSGGVQPGTSKSILTSDNGLSLTPSAVTTVDLNATSSATSQPTADPVAASHHINPALLGISIALVVLAIGLFWGISRSAKSTTDYS